MVEALIEVVPAMLGLVATAAARMLLSRNS